MPLLLKALLFGLKTRRGRELLFVGAVGAYDLARSERARAAYAKAWETATDPRPRQKVAGYAKSAAGKVKR